MVFLENLYQNCFIVMKLFIFIKFLEFLHFITFIIIIQYLSNHFFFQIMINFIKLND